MDPHQRRADKRSAAGILIAITISLPGLGLVGCWQVEANVLVGFQYYPLGSRISYARRFRRRRAMPNMAMPNMAKEVVSGTENMLDETKSA